MTFVEFAPLNVPLERRLQVLAAAYYVFFFLFIPPISIFLAVYLMYTQFWWINFLYLIWFIYDFRSPERGSHPQKWHQNLTIWKYFAKYFPQELVKTAELPPDRNYIIGCHPHGILSIGTYTTLCTNGTGFWEKYPGLTPYLATLAGNFWFPFRREFVLIAGLIACCKRSLTYMLTNKKGIAIGIVLGGADEALDCHPGCHNVLLLNRKGFVKLALQTGTSLVPCYNFGENDVYKQVPNERGSALRDFQIAFRRFADFTPPIIQGRGLFNYNFGLLPFRKPIHTVVGRPIDVDLTPNPTAEQINQLHERYCMELKKLFNENKEKYGVNKDAELNIY